MSGYQVGIILQEHPTGSIPMETPARRRRAVLRRTARPLFKQIDDHYGLSPIEAAATAVDVHNAAGAWNKALLDNSARPSGALVYESRQGLPLAGEQFERLKAELEQGFQGSANAGRPLLLEGGLDWRPLSLSPKDMDFVKVQSKFQVLARTPGRFLRGQTALDLGYETVRHLAKQSTFSSTQLAFFQK